MTKSNKTSFERTQRNTVRRVPKRADYDVETVHRLFDQAWFCHVGFISETGPTIIPMFHARLDDRIILHGATTSRLMMLLATGAPICLSVAMVDGLVLARSIFHHSLNYRSVVAFGYGEVITEPESRTRAFQAIADKVMPGRWDDARQPNEQESKASLLCSVQIESASAKIRTGGPIDDKDDYQLDVWAGVVPLREQMLTPVSDPLSPREIAIPEYIEEFQRHRNG
jgi:uncharacterized protein